MDRPLGSGYSVGPRLGGGGMGEVYAGHVRVTGERVAIKFLRSDLSKDPALIARFVHERQVLTGVVNPHLVTLRDLVIEGDQLAIVMDLVEGSDLRTWASGRGRIGQRTATDLCAQLLEALTAMHDAGIVHRDVKPENVLLEDGDSAVPFAKLSDFGIARVADGPLLTRRSGMIGTPLYMAPELATNDPIGAAVDVYAAGAVYYELLAGRQVFEVDSVVGLIRCHADVMPERPDPVDDRVWAVIERMLAKDPAGRPTTREARDELEALLPTLTDVAEPPRGSHPETVISPLPPSTSGAGTTPPPGPARSPIPNAAPPAAPPPPAGVSAPEAAVTFTPQPGPPQPGTPQPGTPPAVTFTPQPGTPGAPAEPAAPAAGVAGPVAADAAFATTSHHVPTPTDTTISGVPVAVITPAPPRRHRRPMMAVVATVAVLAIAGAAYALTGRSHTSASTNTTRRIATTSTPGTTTAPTAVQPAVARFTVACPNGCIFDATQSAGTRLTAHSSSRVTRYEWNFGDHSYITVATPKVLHVYHLAGTHAYRVILVVIDDSGRTARITRTIKVKGVPASSGATGTTTPVTSGTSPTTAPPSSGSGANQRPSASFTIGCNALSCSANGAGSHDADGSIVSYSWSFGDGAFGSGTQTSHTYGKAGTYTVTLTVRDNQGATASTTRTVGVSAPPPPLSAPGSRSASGDSCFGIALQTPYISGASWHFGGFSHGSASYNGALGTWGWYANAKGTSGSDTGSYWYTTSDGRRSPTSSYTVHYSHSGSC